MRPKSFGTFEKRAPGPLLNWRPNREFIFWPYVKSSGLFRNELQDVKWFNQL